MRKIFLTLSITSAFILFFLYHPKLTYATTLFQDNFTDADNTELSQHNSIWVNNGGADSAGYVLNNQLTFPWSSGSFYALNGFSNQSDQCAAVDYNANGYGGAAVALDVRYSINSKYELSISEGAWFLQKLVTTGPTVLASGSRNPDFGIIDSLKLCAVGSVIDAYVDNMLVASVSDSSISQGTAGIIANQPVIMDNFVYTDGSEVSPYPTPVPPSPPAPTPTPPVLFQDAFNDYNTTDLHNHNQTWVNQFGHAYIFDNRLNFDYLGSTFYTLDGFTNVSNQCVATDYYYNGYGGATFILNARYSTTGWYDLYLSGAAWGLEKWINNDGTALAFGNIDPSTVNSLKLCAVGSVIDAYINNTLVSSVSDSSISQGTAGIFTNQPVLLDNFVYTQPVPDNTSPIIAQIPNSTINEGDVYSYTGFFTDQDSTGWTATVDYGDGSGVQPLALSGTSFSLNHVYKDNGTYTTTVLVADNQGATGVGTVTITVDNVLPAVGLITVSANPIQVNMSTTVSATFTDPGVSDTHTASWNWGDGVINTGTVTESNGSGSVSNSHTYTQTGVYAITLTITDKDGGNVTQIFQYLSVYNPTPQGLFSAGQKYTSPAGAYSQDTSLTGIVLFGLSYKYQGVVPVGNRQFSMDFNAANLHFNATTISSLVIADGMGILTGTGTLNGSGVYNFLVTGSESTNTIRIQIKDQSNNVVYDTQPGATDTTTPTTPVSAGIVLTH